jgi:hypothetical protein
MTTEHPDGSRTDPSRVIASLARDQVNRVPSVTLRS